MASNPTTKWDYESYAAIPNDGKRHEIIDGEHFVNPAPNLYHQTLSRRIQFQLYEKLELHELGVVFNAPVDVQLSDHDIVQPDLAVIMKARKNIMTPIKIKGAPDLVVEILLPSNPNHDLKRKRQLYEQYAVAEYWIVDPDEQQILQLVLADGKYEESTHVKSIRMTTDPFAEVDLTKVW